MTPYQAIILYLCVGAFLYGVASGDREPDGIAMLMTATTWPLMVVSFIGHDIQQRLDGG